MLLTTLAVAFAAFCVWLMVRIVNRRERWAKRTLTIIGLPMLYVASFGPACWLCEHKIVQSKTAWIVYRPVIWLACEPELRIAPVICEYAHWWGDRRRIMSDSQWNRYRNVREKVDFRYDDSVSPIDYEMERVSWEKMVR